MANQPQINRSTPQNIAGSPSPSLPNSVDGYDIPAMYIEGLGKSGIKRGIVQRFTLTCNGVQFNAHIDPESFTSSQSKRVVQLDVLTGIVMQDYAFAPKLLSFRGVTGKEFYKEILLLQNVFENQSINGIPTVSTLVIEGRTYNGIFKDFTFDRKVLDGNIYKYSIEFVVLNELGGAGSASGATNGATASVIAANTAIVSANNANGQAINQSINYAGRTPRDYVKSQVAIPATQRSAALAYLQNAWASNPANSSRSWPGSDGRLRKNEFLVVPLSWSSVLNSQSIQVLSGDPSGGLSTQSGNAQAIS